MPKSKQHQAHYKNSAWAQWKAYLIFYPKLWHLLKKSQYINIRDIDPRAPFY